MNAEPFVMLRTKAAAAACLRDLYATHYEVLGVSPGACDRDTLSYARREAVRPFHPDRNGALTAHDYTARANVAYSTLANVDNRKLYDAQLRSTHMACPSCSGEGFKLKSRGFSAQERHRCVTCSGWGWLSKKTGR